MEITSQATRSGTWMNHPKELDQERGCRIPSDFGKNVDDNYTKFESLYLEKYRGIQ